MHDIHSTTDVSFFREKTSKEKAITLAFGYLTGVVESWWKKNNNQDTHTLKSQLVNLFLTYLRTEDIFHFDKVGLANGAAAGERMRAINGGQYVLDKIRAGLSNAKNHVSTAETGTFLIVANHKILHARPMLNIDANEVRQQANNSTFNTTPRLLFRSKGPRKQYYPLDETAYTREAF